MKGVFGFVLRGSHPSIITNEVSSHLTVRIYHTRINDLNDIFCSSHTSVVDELNKFLILRIWVSLVNLNAVRADVASALVGVKAVA